MTPPEPERMPGELDRSPELEAALSSERQARRSLEAALEVGGGGFALFEVDAGPPTGQAGPRLRLAYANAVAQAAFELRTGEVLASCLAPRPSARIWGLVWDVLKDPDGGPRRALVDVDHPNGQRSWDVTVAAAGPDQAVVTWRDGTGDEAARRQLDRTVSASVHAVTHDAVTGLPNGALLRGALIEALAAARIDGRRLVVVFCDLGGLVESVSRHYGVPVGEGLLRATADRLRGRLRRGDVAARVGSDTFALVLGWPATTVNPRRVLDRIRDLLDRPLAVRSTLLAPSVSLGLVIADPTVATGDRDRDADAVILRAFEAMQRSKAVGEPVVAAETEVEAELARIAALESFDVHDGALDGVFRSVAQLAATACGAPNALVTFIDADLQWVRSAVGARLPTPTAAPGPRHLALCDLPVRRRRLVVLPDLRHDQRCASRHVAWQDGAGSYAGAPLTDREGRVIGTICVLDDVPRDFTAPQRRSLTNLAEVVMTVLEARRSGS